MRGVMFNGNRQAEIREFPDPHAGPGEAVVKVRASVMVVFVVLPLVCACPQLVSIRFGPA